MSETHEPVAFACNECQAGMMRLQFITYFTWLDEELVTVPNFPAWVCDVCGKREYDERAVNWLTTLLSPNAGQTTLTSRRQRRIPPARRGQNRPSSTE
jgi:YgiT-type zinc finger domain-containing protein